MKIVVLIKEVPDTGEDRLLDLETGLADRADATVLLDEIGERALEAALAYADSTPDTEVTVLSMGPESAQTSIRKALAMGAQTATQVVDEQLIGADLLLTAETLAAALRRMEFDLVLAGNVSTDGGGGAIPAMLAELLNVPAATGLSNIKITESSVSGTRSLDDATAEISAPLPAVASITEALPEPRFPNFKGVMAAKKKPIETWSLADLEVDPLPADTARSIMLSVDQRPPRESGIIITDEGDAGRQLADYLLQNNLT